MELKAVQAKILPLFQKYKYVIIVLLVGILLMLLPSNIFGERKQTERIDNTPQTESVQMQLENILSYIQGAGDVKVMLKEMSGAETIYQTNEDVSVSENNTDTRSDVITITDQNRNEYGLVKQVNPPKYSGAIILCQGGDSPNVKLAIIDAVSKITGLGSDKIAVLKMK